MKSDNEDQKLLMPDAPPVSTGVYRILFVLVLAVAAALRLWRMGADEMWFDETISAVTAMGSVRDILTGTYSPKSPPLYYLMLHYWAAVFGITEGALRGMSAALGLGLVAGVGVVGSRLFSRAAGLCAMAVAALAPLGVHYSNEARAYMLLALLALWHIYFTISLTGKRGPGVWAGYILTGAALAFTHVWGLFMLPVANILFLWKPLRKDYVKLLAAQAVIAAVAIPFWWNITNTSSLDMAAWVADLWRQLRPGEAFLDTLEGLGAGGSYSKLMFRLYQPPTGVGSAVNIFAVTFFLGLLALGITRRTPPDAEPPRRIAGGGVSLALIVPLLIGYAITVAWQPVYLVGRTDFIVAPAFYLLAGAGISRLNPKLITVSLVVIIFLASYNLSFFYTRAPFDANRSTARYIIDNTAPDDSVVCTGSTCFPLMYYLPRYGHPRDIIHFPSLAFSVAAGTDPGSMLARRDELITQAQQVRAALLNMNVENRSVFITTDRARFREVNDILFAIMGTEFSFTGIENEESGVSVIVYEKK